MRMRQHSSEDVFISTDSARPWVSAALLEVSLSPPSRSTTVEPVKLRWQGRWRTRRGEGSGLVLRGGGRESRASGRGGYKGGITHIDEGGQASNESKKVKGKSPTAREHTHIQTHCLLSQWEENSAHSLYGVLMCKWHRNVQAHLHSKHQSHWRVASLKEISGLKKTNLINCTNNVRQRHTNTHNTPTLWTAHACTWASHRCCLKHLERWM